MEHRSLVARLDARIAELFQDRLRFAATLIGIVFSVVLVMVQMGLYFGFGRVVTTIDRPRGRGPVDRHQRR